MKDANFHLYTDLSGSLIQGVISHRIDIPIAASTCCPGFQWSTSKLNVWSTFCRILMVEVVNKNTNCFNRQRLRHGISQQLPSHDSIRHDDQCYWSGEEYGIDPASRGNQVKWLLNVMKVCLVKTPTATAMYSLLTHSHFNKAQLQVSRLY